MECCCCCWIAHLVFAIPVLVFYFTAYRKPTLGLRPYGGSLWKQLVGYLLIRFRAPKESTVMKVDGRVPPADPNEKEYNDSFVFQGSDEKGNWMIIRLGFRHGFSEIWFLLKGPITNGEEVKVEKEIGMEEDDTSISSGGLRFIPLEDGKFRIIYQGVDEDEFTVDLLYTPRSKMYHSGRHMDPLAFARGMSEMKWSCEYFQSLRSEYQCRIEQGGSLIGAVTLGDGTNLTLNMKAFRDHSWGKRKWSFIHRYVWWLVTLEEPIIIGKKKYDCFIYVAVRYGQTFDHLVSGWIAGKDDVLPIVEGTDFDLVGGNGVIPPTNTIRFRAPEGPVLTMHMQRDNKGSHSWFTEGGNFEINEAHCFVEVNGIRGIGMAEFGYAKDHGYQRSFPE